MQSPTPPSRSRPRRGSKLLPLFLAIAILVESPLRVSATSYLPDGAYKVFDASPIVAASEQKSSLSVMVTTPTTLSVAQQPPLPRRLLLAAEEKEEKQPAAATATTSSKKNKDDSAPFPDPPPPPPRPTGKKAAAQPSAMYAPAGVDYGANFTESFPSRSRVQTANAGKHKFEWGVASSAFQIEGGNAAGGRAPSIWDAFIADKYGYVDGSPINSWEHWKGDVAAMKALGAKVYRFSISWARMFPDGGRGKINERAVAYYRGILDALHDAGIRPLVNLYHFDLPQSLQEEYGGWASPKIVEDFGNYATAVFKEFGGSGKGKAADWLTMNEPKNAASLGYGIGVHAPFLKNPATNSSSQWNVLLHMIQAHAAAVKAYKKQGIKGRIGVALDSEWTLPVDPDSEKDVAAAQRYIDYRLGSFADPLYFGQWPASVRERLEPTGELPAIPRELSEFLVENKPKTFFLNYYTTKYIWDVPGKRCGYGDGRCDLDERYESKDGVPVGPRAESPWLFVYPDGLRRVLDYVNKRYKPEEIWLSESGLDTPGEDKATGDNILDDPFRLDAYRLLIAAADAAVVDDGVPLTTYLAWSLTDGLEWQEGMTRRFGIAHVDSKGDRVPKASGIWLAKEFGTLPKNSKLDFPPAAGGKNGTAGEKKSEAKKE